VPRMRLPRSNSMAGSLAGSGRLLFLVLVAPALATGAHNRVQEIRQAPDYVDQRVRGVGLGAWGGPLRLELAPWGADNPPITSIWVDRTKFLAGDDPFAGRIEIALVGQIHGSEAEARAAVESCPLSQDKQNVVYAHYRGEARVVFPTVLSETTAPRIIHAVRTLLQNEQANAQRASATLLESFIVLGGVRLPIPVGGTGASAGRLIVPAGRVLSAEEAEVATLLVREGRTVEALAEGTVRTADFAVDGIATELKTVSRLSGKDLSTSLARRILEGAGQASHIFIDGRRQAGLTEEIARRAAARAFGADARIEAVRLLGDGFDITIPRVVK